MKSHEKVQDNSPRNRFLPGDREGREMPLREAIMRTPL